MTDTYGIGVSADFTGLAIREAVDVVAVVLDSLPPRHDGADPTVVQAFRLDHGRMGTDASKRFVVRIEDASVVAAGNAVHRLKQTLDSYEEDHRANVQFRPSEGVGRVPAELVEWFEAHPSLIGEGSALTNTLRLLDHAYSEGGCDDPIHLSAHTPTLLPERSTGDVAS